MLKQVFVFLDIKTHIYNPPSSSTKAKSSKYTNLANPKVAKTKMKANISN